MLLAERVPWKNACKEYFALELKVLIWFYADNAMIQNNLIWKLKCCFRKFTHTKKVKPFFFQCCCLQVERFVFITLWGLIDPFVAGPLKTISHIWVCVSHFKLMECSCSDINRDFEREREVGKQVVYSQYWGKITRDMFSIKGYLCVD